MTGGKANPQRGARFEHRGTPRPLAYGDHHKHVPRDQRPRCDKGCGTILRTTNPYGRCDPCCQRHGYPALAEPGAHPNAHNAACVCFDIRERALDPHGKPLKRGRRDVPVWLIPITCPDCGTVRKVRADSCKGGPPCNRDYLITCLSCAAKRASHHHHGAAA